MSYKLWGSHSDIFDRMINGDVIKNIDLDLSLKFRYIVSIENAGSNEPQPKKSWLYQGKLICEYLSNDGWDYRVYLINKSKEYKFLFLSDRLAFAKSTEMLYHSVSKCLSKLNEVMMSDGVDLIIARADMEEIVEEFYEIAIKPSIPTAVAPSYYKPSIKICTDIVEGLTADLEIIITPAEPDPDTPHESDFSVEIRLVAVINDKKITRYYRGFYYWSNSHDEAYSWARNVFDLFMYQYSEYVSVLVGKV